MSNLSSDLPLEIWCDILLRFPAESLVQYRTVCKLWCTVIDDPSFTRAHTFVHHQLSSSSSNTLVINSRGPPCDYRLHTFDLDDINLYKGDQEIKRSSLDLSFDEASSLIPPFPLSACNGLILIYTSENPKPTLEIWNPSTRERLQLPPIGFSHERPVFFGLGYDQAAQDFKAVAMNRLQTRVYSLRSDTWRTIGDCLCTDDLLAAEKHGVFLCGALHWLFNNKKIIALDLGTEKHRHIHLNALQKTLGFNKKRMDVLNGCLFVSGINSYSYFEVWVMKDYGSDDESWTKLFSIYTVYPINARKADLRPVAYIKDKNQMFLSDGHVSGFMLFDIEGDSLKSVRINDFTGDFLDAQIIPRSIFRLRDHCGGGNGTSTILPLGRPRKMIKTSFTINMNTYPTNILSLVFHN